jgi:hypothetical protein
MSDATIRKNRFGVYQVRLRLGGRQYERSLKTAAKRDAQDKLGAIRTTLRHIREGVLNLPEGLDPVAFVVSGGKLKAAPTSVGESAALRPRRPPTLRQAGERSLASFPTGSKPPETLATERTHLKHLYRLLGVNRSLGGLTRTDLQDYVNRRAGEKGVRGTVRRKTIKMELDTFAQVWGWAVDESEVTGPCPTTTRQEGRQRRLAVNLPAGRQKEPSRH